MPGVYGADSKKHILRVFLFVDDDDLLGTYLSFLRDETLIWSGEKMMGWIHIGEDRVIVNSIEDLPDDFIDEHLRPT